MRINDGIQPATYLKQDSMFKTSKMYVVDSAKTSRPAQSHMGKNEARPTSVVMIRPFLHVVLDSSLLLVALP